MTISIAWVRNDGSTPELVFASDSRLNGGGNVDQCQKVFSLPREDCCIAFAGSTGIAYPFVHQLQNFITDYKKFRDRATDLTNLRGPVVALLNRFVGAYKGYVPEDFADDLRGTSFLFGGWSWKTGGFRMWRIYYDKGNGKYVPAACGVWDTFGLSQNNPVEIGFVGDYRGAFLQRLKQKLDDKGKIKTPAAPVRVNYEPLQVLSEMLRDDAFVKRQGRDTGLIGGGPQVVKVYPFMRTMHYAVEWKADRGYYLMKGRTTAEYEVIDALAIDPMTGETYRPARPYAWREAQAT